MRWIPSTGKSSESDRVLNVELASEADLPLIKEDMQEAFQTGAVEGLGGFDGQVLPESDIDKSLGEKGCLVYKAVLDGNTVGGAIIIIDTEKHSGDLHFLYVKNGMQGKKIGQTMWKTIESYHPEIDVWTTCTPYFDKRNIHFYINVCGFHATEFFSEHHRDPNFPKDEEDFGGMFSFEKVIRQ
jgi:hypothetical protein